MWEARLILRHCRTPVQLSAVNLQKLCVFRIFPPCPRIPHIASSLTIVPCYKLLGQLILMSLRILPRTLRSCSPRSIVAINRRGQFRLYSNGAAEARDNPTSSAEQVPTSHPPSPKQVPFTIESHGPVKQNPQHAKKVLSLQQIC